MVNSINPYAIPVTLTVPEIGTLTISYDTLSQIGKEHHIRIEGVFGPSDLNEFAQYVTEFFLKTVGKEASQENKALTHPIVAKVLVGTRECPGPCAYTSYPRVIINPDNRPKEPFSWCILS